MEWSNPHIDRCAPSDRLTARYFSDHFYQGWPKSLVFLSLVFMIANNMVIRIGFSLAIFGSTSLNLNLHHPSLSFFGQLPSTDILYNIIMFLGFCWSRGSHYHLPHNYTLTNVQLSNSNTDGVSSFYFIVLPIRISFRCQFLMF